MNCELRPNLTFHPLVFWLHLAGVMLIVMVFMGVAGWKARHPNQLTWLRPDMSEHLGAEYNSIATALRDGRGFSDPFHDESGPTVWMPPVLPYLLAAVYWFNGDSRDAAVEFMVMLQAMAVLLAAMIVVWQARKLGSALVGYLVVTGGMAANFHELFQKTHDSGLLLLLVSLLWLGSVGVWNGVARWRHAIGWGAFGGFCALCSPVFGGVWGVLTAVRLWPTAPRREWRGFVPLALAATVSMLVVTPWTIRNRVVLGKWLPIKSNGMYEVWQSQCPDEDGVLDIEASAWHPWPSNGEQRQRYKTVGEIAFIAEKGELAKQSIREQPFEFLNRVANRWFAACVYYTAFYPSDEQVGGGWPIFFKRLAFASPMLGCLIILALRRVPLEPEIAAALSIWIMGLLPYVLVSYYDRYAAPLVGIKMLIVVYSVHSVLQIPLRTRT